MENMQQSATLSASSLRISVVARRPYCPAREILQKTWTGTELRPAIHLDFIFSVYLDFFSFSFRFCVRSKWQVCVLGPPISQSRFPVKLNHRHKRRFTALNIHVSVGAESLSRFIYSRLALYSISIIDPLVQKVDFRVYK